VLTEFVEITIKITNKIEVRTAGMGLNSCRVRGRAAEC
jgi:hypothetical protein